MANEGSVSISVTLDKSKSPPVLGVDQRTLHHEIDSKHATVTIKWHLAGDAAGGVFLPLSGAEPGFAWDTPAPPPGVFGAPRLAADAKSLSLVDDQPGFLGTWSYTLRVRIDGTVYVGEPLELKPVRGNTNPVIKNK